MQNVSGRSASTPHLERGSKVRGGGIAILVALAYVAITDWYGIWPQYANRPLPAVAKVGLAVVLAGAIYLGQRGLRRMLKAQRNRGPAGSGAGFGVPLALVLATIHTQREMGSILHEPGSWVSAWLFDFAIGLPIALGAGWLWMKGMGLLAGSNRRIPEE